MKKTPILIIGNGISGITAARHIRKRSDCPIVVISEETQYFFSRTALMYVYMGHMPFEHTKPYENDFWKKNKIELLRGSVKTVKSEKKQVELADGVLLDFSALIIASGSRPKLYGWPGQELDAVQGFYHKKDLDNMESWSATTQEAVVVGGGLIGIELAEMLRSRDIKVTFLVRESSFWNSILPAEESAMVNTEIRRHGVDLLLNTELKAIKTLKDKRVGAVETSCKTYISAQWVGLATGVEPNISFLKGSGIALGRGVLVNRYLETNVPDIYAIGDCAEQQHPSAHRRPIEAVWYTGRMMGETVAQTLTGNRSIYAPGHWFNSAKFFDLEYQTYGRVSPNPKPEEEKHFLWQEDTKKRLIRLAYNPKNNLLLGVNVLGIRFRHTVIDRWLTEKRTIDDVIQKINEVDFDPEFSAKYYPKLLKYLKQKDDFYRN